MKSLLSSLALLLMLGGCNAVNHWADDTGQHFPVIGKRCEYWQCFTAYGQQQSEINREKSLGAPPPVAPPISLTEPSPYAIRTQNPMLGR